MAAPSSEKLSESDLDRGVLYTSFGAKYVEEARISARSLKRHNPGIKTCVATDMDMKPDAEFDIILPITPPHEVENFVVMDRGAYYRKIPEYPRSPFQRTVYLDGDTFVNGSLDGLFELLKRYDLLITPDGNAEANYSFELKLEPFISVPRAFGAFNAGVLCYRKSPATELFFKQWADNYLEHVQRHTINDQPAFRLTLWQSDIRYHVIPGMFNWFSWIPNVIPAGGKVIVMHGRNPWLFRWAHLLDAPTQTVVGGTPWKHSCIWFVSRVLHWLSRRGIIPKPKL